MDMSARDLKLAIVDQRKLNNITEFDLSIKNQQTNQVCICPSPITMYILVKIMVFSTVCRKFVPFIKFFLIKTGFI